MKSDVIGTDYAVRSATLSPAGHVTFEVSDRRGQVYAVTVPRRFTEGETPDKIIRQMIAVTRPARVAP